MERYEEIKEILEREDTVIEVTEKHHITILIIVRCAVTMLNQKTRIVRLVHQEWVGRYCGMKNRF